jgi:hypothetical protein
MPILLLRFLPFVSGLAVYGLVSWQWQHPLTYPWACLGALAVVIAAVGLLLRDRQDRWSLAWTVFPTTLFLGAVSLAALMVERAWLQTGLSGIAGLVVYLVLELLFFHLYLPARYPVHGLTYLQTGLIPLTNAFFAWGSAGAMIFARNVTPWWLIPILLGAGNALMFSVTSLSESTAWQRRAWTIFGGSVGMLIGCLLLLLPLGIPGQALLAGLLSVLPLRWRRYTVHPRPGPWALAAELLVFCALFFSVIFFSRWA